MEINIAKLVETSLPVLEGFKRIEPRQWGLDGTFLELNTEIGALGRVLTIWENYRHGRKSRHNLADELSDIFFVLVKIIQETNTSISDSLTVKRIQSAEQEFFRLLELAAELRSETGKRVPHIESTRKKAEEMFSIIGGLASYYHIDFEKAHEEEMKFASLWQRLFFNSDGTKKRSLLFARKVFWKFAIWQHQRKLEHKVP